MLKKIKLIVQFLTLLSVCATLQAAEKVYGYPEDALYQSAYRFLALEKHFQITKENLEIGLIVFTYQEEGNIDKTSSVEIIKDSTLVGGTKVRVQVPSISDATVNLMMDQLNKKIEQDFASAGIGEELYKFPFEKIFSSVYRYLAVDKKCDIEDAKKEKGIILFSVKESGLQPQRGYLEIIKVPQGDYKVRISIPTLAQSTVKTYLNGIKEKLRNDYQKEN